MIFCCYTLPYINPCRCLNCPSNPNIEKRFELQTVKKYPINWYPNPNKQLKQQFFEFDENGKLKSIKITYKDQEKKC